MNIVFDFGAVLFNWQPALLLQQYFPERVGSVSGGKALARTLFNHPDWHAFDRGVLDMETVIERTTNRLDLPPQATRDMVLGIAEHLQPMPGSVALLRQLHARRGQGPEADRLYYLSNMPLPYAHYLQARHPFLACFDGGVFSSEVQLAKPDAAIYLTLQRRYGLRAQETLFIDDMPANVQAAQALGWQAIQFDSAQQLAARLNLGGE